MTGHLLWWEAWRHPNLIDRVNQILLALTRQTVMEVDVVERVSHQTGRCRFLGDLEQVRRPGSPQAALPLAVQLGFSRTAQGRTPTILTANGCSTVLNPRSHCGGRCGVPLDQKRPRAPVRIGPGLEVLGVFVQRAV